MHYLTLQFCTVGEFGQLANSLKNKSINQNMCISMSKNLIFVIGNAEVSIIKFSKNTQLTQIKYKNVGFIKV